MKTNKYINKCFDISNNLGAEYILLAGLRIILTILPQTGYIHPDEYFQSLEIVIGDIFNAERTEVWEYDHHSPIRNIAIPFLFYGLPCYVIKLILIGLGFRGPVSPYVLLIPVRLTICLISFAVDVSLISICRNYETNAKSRLILLASSYVMLIYGTRTFSNTIEMIFFSYLLSLVVEAVINAEKVYSKIIKLEASLESEKDNPRQKVIVLRELKKISHCNNSNCFNISTIMVLGVFNRPTFIAFAIGPIFFWLYRGPSLKEISFYTVQFRLLSLVAASIPTVIILVLADTIYYKHFQLFHYLFNVGITSCVHNIMDCFTITPLNFFKYNLNSSNLEEHGLHSRYLHMLVNVPLLYNILGISVWFMILSVIVGIFWRRKNNMSRFDSITGLMFVSVIIPLAVLSIIPHQEARFLIPLTLPIIFLRGLNIFEKIDRNEIKNRRSEIGKSKILFSIWCVVNFMFTYFFGFLHQGGILPALNHLTTVRTALSKNNTSIHVLSSFTYSIPKTFLTVTLPEGTNLSSQPRSNIIVYPTTSTSFDASMRQLELVFNIVHRKKPIDRLIYFLIPAALISNFTLHPKLKSLNIGFLEENHIRWHVSTEAMPTWPSFLSNRIKKEIGLKVIVFK